MTENEKEWPPIPGDFEVKNPTSCVAICTLGKKFEVSADYAIIGTCKTENIGIERVIVNVISNSAIRFLIMAGPEVPGHRTGLSFKCLYEYGIDENTRKIIDADGAIPYVENIPIDAIERFRAQVEFIDMMNISNPEVIAEKVNILLAQDPGKYPEDPLWIDFRAASSGGSQAGLTGAISVLPEYGVTLDPANGLIAKSESGALVALRPSSIGVEVRVIETGTILVGKEL